MDKITKIYFRDEHIIGIVDSGAELSQSMLWYPKLLNASEDIRDDYTFGLDGIFWNKIDVQISFESFWYPDAEPTKMQRFFLTHPEINVSGFAKRFGLNPSLLRSYVNGFKTPSVEREREILDYIHSLGEEYYSY